MPQILVEALAKTYRVAERAPGLGGALRGLVRRRWREVHALTFLAWRRHSALRVHRQLRPRSASSAPHDRTT